MSFVYLLNKIDDAIEKEKNKTQSFRQLKVKLQLLIFFIFLRCSRTPPVSADACWDLGSPSCTFLHQVTGIDL
jgi:hypothetical protein